MFETIKTHGSLSSSTQMTPSPEGTQVGNALVVNFRWARGEFVAGAVLSREESAPTVLGPGGTRENPVVRFCGDPEAEPGTSARPPDHNGAPVRSSDAHVHQLQPCSAYGGEHIGDEVEAPGGVTASPPPHPHEEGIAKRAYSSFSEKCSALFMGGLTLVISVMIAVGILGLGLIALAPICCLALYVIISTALKK